MTKRPFEREARRPFRQSAGKGDKPRPVNMDKYRENYDAIFGKKGKEDNDGSKTDQDPTD